VNFRNLSKKSHINTTPAIANAIPTTIKIALFGLLAFLLPAPTLITFIFPIVNPF